MKYQITEIKQTKDFIEISFAALANDKIVSFGKIQAAPDNDYFSFLRDKSFIDKEFFLNFDRKVTADKL